MIRTRFLFALLVCFSSSAALIHAQVIAPTPPMGWNSWDAYGLTINEADYKANASVLAEFQRYGWKYAVVDEGWYMANPAGKTVEDKQLRVERKRLADSSNGSVSIGGKRRRLQARWPIGFMRRG